MTDEKRCEPPPEWRGKDRLVCWLQRSDNEQMLAIWRTGPVHSWNIFGSDSECLPDGWLAEEGWRYLAPVTPPSTVAALVAALEAALSAGEALEERTGVQVKGLVWPNARAALSLYRGEGKR